MTGPVLGGAARLVNRGDVMWFRAPALSFHTDVEHGVTHASLGNFSLTTADDPQRVTARREAVIEAAGLEDALLFAPPLHHSANVGRVYRGELVDTSPDPSEGRYDALIANEPGTVLAVTVADCVPVFFVDVEEVAFGVAHAGWRGVFGGIVRKTVTAMIEEFGTKPGNLLVGTGPAIRGPELRGRSRRRRTVPRTVHGAGGRPRRGARAGGSPVVRARGCRGRRRPEGQPRRLLRVHLRAPGRSLLASPRQPERHWAFIGRSC